MSDKYCGLVSWRQFLGVVLMLILAFGGFVAFGLNYVNGEDKRIDKKVEDTKDYFGGRLEKIVEVISEVKSDMSAVKTSLGIKGP